MRLLLAAVLLTVLAGCVPTTKYRYVPLTQANFVAAQNGEKIPLVAHETALCLADARTVFVRDAEWTETGICSEADPGASGEDDRECYGWDELAGVGIPYEGRSASIIPMAAVQIGKCDPEALTR